MTEPEKFLPDTLKLDKTTMMIWQACLDHQRKNPNVSDETAINVPHLGRRQEEWERADASWRMLLGVRLTNLALDTAEMYQ